MAIFEKHGKVYIDYYFEGRRIREQVGTSKQLAKEALNKRKNEIAEKKFFPERLKNDVTFGQLLAKFWDLQGKFFKSSSWHYYKNELDRKLGNKLLESISVVDIQKYYNEVTARASVSSANRQLTLIRALFNKARLWKEYFKDNPCTGVTKQKEPAHRLRYLTQEEMKSLIEKCSDRLLPIVMCALLTGMRRGEILGLDWANVSLERGTIYLLHTKSGKPREIPISRKLATLLEQAPSRKGNVFQMTLMQLRDDFELACKGAKIARDGFVFHDLRHTFASWFMMKGGNIYTLQKLLGHSDIKMTMKYAHLAKGHLESEMAVFETAIPNGHPKDTSANNQNLNVSNYV